MQLENPTNPYPWMIWTLTLYLIFTLILQFIKCNPQNTQHRNYSTLKITQQLSDFVHDCMYVQGSLLDHYTLPTWGSWYHFTDNGLVQCACVYDPFKNRSGTNRLTVEITILQQTAFPTFCSKSTLSAHNNCLSLAPPTITNCPPESLHTDLHSALIFWLSTT